MAHQSPGHSIGQLSGSIDDLGEPVVEKLLLDWLYSFLTVEEQDCQTMVGCNLRQRQLQQCEHLKKRCNLWASTCQKEMGPAPRAG